MMRHIYIKSHKLTTAPSADQGERTLEVLRPLEVKLKTRFS